MAGPQKRGLGWVCPGVAPGQRVSQPPGHGVQPCGTLQAARSRDGTSAETWSFPGGYGEQPGPANHCTPIFHQLRWNTHERTVTKGRTMAVPPASHPHAWKQKNGGAGRPVEDDAVWCSLHHRILACGVQGSWMCSSDPGLPVLSTFLLYSTAREKSSTFGWCCKQPVRGWDRAPAETPKAQVVLLAVPLELGGVIHLGLNFSCREARGFADSGNPANGDHKWEPWGCFTLGR